MVILLVNPCQLLIQNLILNRQLSHQLLLPHQLLPRQLVRQLRPSQIITKRDRKNPDLDIDKNDIRIVKNAIIQRSDKRPFNRL